VIGLSIMAALGIAGLCGIALSPTAIAAPNIIMTLAVADSVHFLVGWQNERARGESSAQAMINVLKSHLPFVGFTTLATVISFVSMNASDAPPFRDLGNITAMGVVAALWVSIFLMPALAIALPAKAVGQPRALLPAGLNALLQALRKRPRTIAVCGLVGGLIFSQALWFNELDDEYVKYFDSSLSFRQDTDWAEKNLTGIYALEYMLPSPGPDGIFEPAYLAKADAFSDWLRTQPEVTNVFSLVDVIRKLNRNFHGDDAKFYRVPETREAAAQYFLAYELALPQGMDVTDRVDISRSSLRLTAALRNVSSERVRDLERRARQWLDSNAPPTMQVAATGPDRKSVV
jgi:hypothetical protein